MEAFLLLRAPEGGRYSSDANKLGEAVEKRRGVFVY